MQLTTAIKDVSCQTGITYQLTNTIFVVVNKLCSKTLTYMIGASLSEPHTSGTELQDVCVATSVCSHICMYVPVTIY